jgi:mannose-1-phosphate guanylyltransferase
MIRGLILAAGLGTRLRPLTEAVPKPLISIGGETLLDRWVRALTRAGAQKIRVNTHHLRDQMAEHLAWLDKHIEEAHEPELLGSAGAIAANRDFVQDGDTVIVACADGLTDMDLAEMLTFHDQHGGPFTIALFYSPHPERCGTVTMDDGGTVTSFVEKPEEPETDLVNAGVYVMSADGYREIADMDGRDLGYDILPFLVGRMRGFVWNGYYRDIGTYEDLILAREEVRRL